MYNVLGICTGTCTCIIWYIRNKGYMYMMHKDMDYKDIGYMYKGYRLYVQCTTIVIYIYITSVS